jgi:HD-GYP domain-containing protein (c-di-GMP phosphodiesterase class II)
MVRISDILKKKMRDSTPTSEIKPIPSIQPSQAMTPKESAQELTPQKPPEMQIAKVMKELQPNIERSKTLYSKAIQLVKELLIAAAERKSIEPQSIKDLVEVVINCLVLQDKTLFTLYYVDYSAEDYLYHHMVNVMIMSVDVGLGLGYNKSQLAELGLAAFLHDIGMVSVKDIALQPRQLTEEEYNKIKEHPVYGAAIISRLKNFPHAIVSAIQEQHERINGKGYPKGLKDGEITEYARIIAAVDVYEALTHTRAYRKRYSTHEAIKNIISSGSSIFDSRILKVLIDKVGIYPIGSWIELNTNEIGRVITTNDEFPLRPVANLLFDGEGNRLKELRTVDLAKQFNLYVKRPLSDEEVTRKIKEEVRYEESH